MANTYMQRFCGYSREEDDILKGRKGANVAFNVITIISWVLLSVFLCAQPWLSNWANNKWGGHHNKRTLYNITNYSVNITKNPVSYGLCTVPAADYVCTDGSNFTELALKYRPDHLFACGCGEGILGEGLCPRTSYGHTLSDFVSTTPALGAMIGLATFPLIGARRLIITIIKTNDTRIGICRLMYASLNCFQVTFIFWGICSVCVFEAAHALLTVAFLGSFMVFALTVMYALHQHKVEQNNDFCTRLKDFEPEQYVIAVGAFISFVAIVLGSIPRILLMLGTMTGSPKFPDLNNGGIGSYAFWAGEAFGLSIFFGLYPLVLLTNIWQEEATLSTGMGDKFEHIDDEELESDTARGRRLSRDDTLMSEYEDESE